MAIRIKDMATAASVSVITVSCALASGPVGAELRRRIDAAVAVSRYRPNLSARRLRSQQAQMVGLIASDIRNPFFTSISQAVEDVTYTAGLRVILRNPDGGPEKEAIYLWLMEEERVTGVILSPTRGITEAQQPVDLGYSVVLTDRAGPTCGTDVAVLDNQQAAQTLAEHLVAQGYRRIGGLFERTSNTDAEWQVEFTTALARHGITAEAYFILSTAKAAEAETLAWLLDAERGHPDVLVAGNAQSLLGVLWVLQWLSLDAPCDTAAAGFDNGPWTKLAGPGITVIEQPIYDAGHMIMAMLQDRLVQLALPTRRMLLTGRFIPRGSIPLRSPQRAVTVSGYPRRYDNAECIRRPPFQGLSVPTRVIRAACPYDCPDTCTLPVTVEDGRVTRVQGDPNHPTTTDVLHTGVNRYAEHTYHPSHLLMPIKRADAKDEDRFESIS